MMMTMISNFKLLASSGPTVHVAPLPVVHLLGLTLSNSVLYGWLCTILIIVTLVTVARRITEHPKGGLIQFVEVGVEFIQNLVVGAFDDKTKARRYVPYFVTIFFFILFSNWLGLVPGIGEAFHIGGSPLLRPFTADLNGTFAIGLVTMGIVYSASVRESGGMMKYLRHFFVGSPKNPLYLVIGLLEMFTDLTRVFSLSLRLFLNVTIGEIVIAVFSYLGHFLILSSITALPFTLIELFVGGLQAYIFTILSVMYLAIAVNHSSSHPEQDLTEDSVPETMVMKPGRVPRKVKTA
jgi:F-type H+-transporting ATPase subunit a